MPETDAEPFEEPEKEADDSSEIEIIEPVLERLPPDQRQAITQVIQTQMRHSGPLPPPDQLAEYEEVLPGLAERIVRLTEKEQDHRHDIVSQALRRSARLRERGQAMGMAALLITLGFCVYLASVGQPITAGTVAVALVIGVVGIFVTGKIADARAYSEDDDEA